MDTPDLGLSGLRTPRSFTKSFLSLGTLVPLSYSSPCNITPPIRTIQPTCLYRQPEKELFLFRIRPKSSQPSFSFQESIQQYFSSPTKASLPTSIVLPQFRRRPLLNLFVRPKPSIPARNPIRTIQPVFLQMDYVNPTANLDCCLIMQGSFSFSWTMAPSYFSSAPTRYTTSSATSSSYSSCSTPRKKMQVWCQRRNRKPNIPRILSFQPVPSTNTLQSTNALKSIVSCVVVQRNQSHHTPRTVSPTPLKPSYIAFPKLFRLVASQYFHQCQLSC